jgi:hypothetical protein
MMNLLRAPPIKKCANPSIGKIAVDHEETRVVSRNWSREMVEDVSFCGK